MNSKEKFILPALVLVLVVATFLTWRSFHRPPAVPTYIGTAACAACHADSYQKWQQSDHQHAMDVAGASSVLGNFKDATFNYSGVQSRFFMREGKYYVDTDNAKGDVETFQISYTFGHYPLQQYLIAFPDGRLQALSIAWDSRTATQGGQRWFHLYPNEKVTHDNPLHWTGAFQNWNSRCASCHSTNLVKSYSQETDRYDTRWQEINVGCEACHGPGSNHAAWAGGRRSFENKGLVTQIAKIWQPVDGKRDVPPQADFKTSGQIQLCSGCHSLRSELQHPEASASYFDNFMLSPLLEGRYYADGQIQAEVYETGSFLQSRMHQNQVSCTNCHDPHSGRIRMEGNALCLQCHEAQTFQTRDHFFHEPDSPGSQCVSCHMPQTIYMGVDARRDHSFRVPDPIASVEFGVPNACTSCHKDHNAKWAADFLTKRTGRTQPRYPNTPLIAGARNNVRSVASGLLAYADDRMNPPILRSIAVLESARFRSTQQLETVKMLLGSPDPIVRLGAVASLNGLASSDRLSLLHPLFGDAVKSVRIEVARQLIDVPPAQTPADVREALGRLFDEYKQSLLYNADMPESMNDLGLFLTAQGDPTGAEKAIRHALKLAPLYLPAMLNLADIYRAQHRDDLGEPVLRDAMAQYPESGDAHHAMGLLYVRTGRVNDAVPVLEQASLLSPNNAQYAMVYALALVKIGKQSEGIKVLQAAAQRFPDNAAIQQALEAYK
jgi:predicted CXXCH cytochrome family protein